MFKADKERKHSPLNLSDVALRRAVNGDLPWQTPPPPPLHPPSSPLPASWGRRCPPAFVTRCAFMRRGLISGEWRFVLEQYERSLSMPTWRETLCSERASKRRRSFAEPLFQFVQFRRCVIHSKHCTFSWSRRVFIIFFIYLVWSAQAASRSPQCRPLLVTELVTHV